MKFLAIVHLSGVFYACRRSQKDRRTARLERFAPRCLSSSRKTYCISHCERKFCDIRLTGPKQCDTIRIHLYNREKAQMRKQQRFTAETEKDGPGLRAAGQPPPLKPPRSSLPIRPQRAAKANRSGPVIGRKRGRSNPLNQGGTAMLKIQPCPFSSGNGRIWARLFFFRRFGVC